jgi:hypothetical protein
MTGLVALIRHVRAERALARNAIADYEAGITWETPDYHQANDESEAADRAVPRWLRWAREPIWWYIARDLDYWRRTGQAS